ncbi:MAG TPA: Spy/CpxP family protein refolding chaperone, partial [Stellaceae bacterium]|nr:Spy/CpxP family protein refolding chaperone [Stellaceae bacterium]
MTAVSIALRPGSRRQLFRVILVLSLALNLCFIAGALWIRVQGPPLPLSPEQRLQQIEPQLALNPQQKAAFEEYARTVRSGMQSMREAAEPLVANAWSELAKPDADEAKVMLLFDQAGDERRSFRRELGTATFAFLTKLSPEQRAKFVELARQRPWAKRHQDGA